MALRQPPARVFQLLRSLGGDTGEVCCTDCRIHWPIKGEHVCEPDDLAHTQMNREVEAKLRARRAA